MATRTILRRGIWIVPGSVAAVAALLVGFVYWTLDPAFLQPRLIAEVQRATGRDLTISGRMRIALSLAPTVSIEDVSLANPPGFSRPEMAKIARVELSLALVPLLRHRVEIERIALVRPDILLETSAAGVHNWVLTREHPAAPPPPANLNPPQPPPTADTNPPPAGAPAQPFEVSLKDTSIVDGHVGWLDGPSGRRAEIEVPSLTLVAPWRAPALLNGTVVYAGRTIGLTARSGVTDAPEPLPVTATLDLDGATLTVDARLARGQGSNSFAADATVPDPSVLAAFFPNLPLGLLHAATVHAEVTDRALSLLKVGIGSVDLDPVRRGARLLDVALTAQTGTSQTGVPNAVTARLALPGFETGIKGTLGDLAWLTGGATGPVAVDLEAIAGSAHGRMNGTVQAPARMSGFALDVALDVPDPALLTKDAPPALKSVSLRTRLTDAPGPVSFQFSSSAGDLSGEASVTRQPGPLIVGHVSSRRLDLDAFRRPAAQKPPAPAATPGSPTVQAAPPEREPPPPLIPDTKLPFDLARRADVNLRLDFAQITANGADARAVGGVLSVKDGVLRLDPFAIAAPDQRLSLTLTADASKSPPPVHLTIDAPALALRPLLALLGLPQAASGTLAARADLTGTGDTPRAIAASLDGWAGIAVEGGQLDARIVNAWLEQLRPLRIDGADITDLRCFAIRADAKGGIVTIQPVALNTAPLILEGSGEVDLGQESLALRLRPRAKIGGTGIALPVRVSGPLRAPGAKIDISAKGPGGGFVGLLLGGKDVMGAAGGGDPCPEALARARAPGDSSSPRAPGATPIEGAK